MQTYPKILAVLKNKMGQIGNQEDYRQFAKHMHDLFTAKIMEVSRKTKNVIELTIKAPLAAKHFKPGEFYRLQNFEIDAPRIDHTLLQMEPLALTTAEHDPAQGLLHFIVKEETATAKLCATLKLETPVTLMGPTGVRAKIPTEQETILIIGNQSSFAFLRCYGNALRKAQNRVLYIAQLASKEEAYCQDKLENVTDVIVWLTKEGELIQIREKDYALQSEEVVETLIQYAQKKLKGHSPSILLSDVDRIYLIGETELLRRFQAARKTTLKEYFVKDPKIFASVYGNMQCMLKGVCAQCLQWQIDPETGERTKAVFACSWQDQPLEIIDIDHMDERKMQNSLHEKMGNLWVDYLFEQYPIERC